MTPFDAQLFLDEVLKGLACNRPAMFIDAALKKVSYSTSAPKSYSEFLNSVSELVQQVYAQASGEALSSSVCYTKALELLSALENESPINIYLDMIESGYIAWESFQQICVDQLKQQVLNEQTLTRLDMLLAPLDYAQRTEVSNLLEAEYQEAGVILPPHYRSNCLKQTILQIWETRQQESPTAPATSLSKNNLVPEAHI